MKESPKLGRPRKIQTVNQLIKLINEYFEECYIDAEDAKGKIYKKNIKPLTMQGLGVKLGICRDTMAEWQKPNHDFSDTLKKAKQIIEQYAAEQLFTNPRTIGIIFNLKNNHSWVDQTVQDITQKTNISFEFGNDDEDVDDDV